MPDAVASDSARLRLRNDEETEGSEGDADSDKEDNEKPPRLQGFEENRGPSNTNESGEGGIRTRGTVLPVRRFSKAATACHNDQDDKALAAEPKTGRSAGCSDDPELSQILTAWPDLPEHIRRAMLALVEAAHAQLPKLGS